jgi:CHAT domain
MPVRAISGTDLSYALVIFDDTGKERPEPDGTLLSETMIQRVADPGRPISDVLFASHGWQGDVPAAIDQYDRWIGAMAALPADLAAAAQRPGGFAPLIVGLHWPSKPFGDENPPAGAPAVLSAGSAGDVDAWAKRIADTPRARAAITTILQSAPNQADAAAPSKPLLDAYATLFAESGLAARGSAAAPGADQDGFDPQAIIAQSSAGAARPATQLLGVGDTLSELFLSPLRQLSFWKMKDRARAFGESGGHDLLRRLQAAAPKARFHLMGHSFGCIVASATIAGPEAGAPLPRPVDSLFLVQGALSLWSYASDIPYAAGTPGYFHRIAKDGLVGGPILTTRSSHDTAVGRFYPLGAQIRQQLVLGDDFPAYGGIGSFGIQGTTGAVDMPMRAATFAYGLQAGTIYNLEASAIICNGGGASGAHSDIAHPEVAHAFWAAVLWSAKLPPAATLSPAGSGPGAAPATPRGGLLGGSGPAVSGASAGAVPGGLAGSAAPSAAPTRPTTRGRSAPPQAPVPQPLARSEPPPAAAVGRSAPGAPGPPEPAGAPPAERWINVELEDTAAEQILAAGQWYTLALGVDVTRHIEALATAPLADQSLFPEGVDEIDVTVQLDSADFKIADSVRPLRVPRAGKSSNKARFDISPLRDGASTLTATLHKDGNFLQNIVITLVVGGKRPAPVDSTACGRPPSAANVLQPRDIGVSLAQRDGGYECVVWGAVAARATLPLQPAYLASGVDALRHELMKVVMQQDANGAYVFQAGIDIAAADRDAALTTMARAGALLFQRLFFGPGAGADSKAIGDFLRQQASDPAKRLKLQVVAAGAPIPWSLLYVGDASAGARLDWDLFIGMRHVIEEIPLQTTLTVTDSAISSDQPQLAVSVNVNNGIDAQLGVTVVAEQQAYWAAATAARKRIAVTSRSTRVDVVHALASDATDDQIVYFYCHAASSGLADPGAASLVLTDAAITLADLDLDAPTSTLLRGKPLVFINACESAELSPAFYDGFVPYFMAKGARGVVGTQCKTPALFAAEWGKRFFERFLDGAALGDAFLALRREFLTDHGNPLGLLYAVYCDGDTRVAPALL